MLDIPKWIQETPVHAQAWTKNKLLIRKYQNSSNRDEKNKLIYELINMNIRMLGFVKQKYGNGFEYSELLSIYYDVMVSAAEGYDFQFDNSPQSFVNYVVRKFRAKISTDRYQKTATVKYPRESKIKPKFTDLVEVYAVAYEEEEDERVIELDDLVEKYSKRCVSQSDQQELELFKLNRILRIREISNLPKYSSITESAIGMKIRRCVNKLKKFKNIATYLLEEEDALIG